MRKRYRVLILASLVAAFIVPVGYALSVESTASPTRSSYADIVPSGALPSVAAAVVTAPVTLRAERDDSTAPLFAPLSDATKLAGIGTILFGLAAVVRKAV